MEDGTGWRRGQENTSEKHVDRSPEGAGVARVRRHRCSTARQGAGAQAALPPRHNCCNNATRTQQPREGRRGMLGKMGFRSAHTRMVRPVTHTRAHTRRHTHAHAHAHTPAGTFPGRQRHAAWRLAGSFLETPECLRGGTGS